jgi:hypothetical protein
VTQGPAPISPTDKETTMSAILEQPEVVRTMQETLQAVPAPQPVSPGAAVDSKPLIGGEITIHIALSPGMITLLAAPLTVLATMLLAWLALRTIGLPIHPAEMLGGAIANTVGGMVASIPLFVLMRKGAQAIAQAGILGIALRVGTVIVGLLVASAPAWGLRWPFLPYWVLAFYFPMLIVETAVVAWLTNKAAH